MSARLHRIEALPRPGEYLVTLRDADGTELTLVMTVDGGTPATAGTTGNTDTAGTAGTAGTSGTAGTGPQVSTPTATLPPGWDAGTDRYRAYALTPAGVPQ